MPGFVQPSGSAKNYKRSSKKIHGNMVEVTLHSNKNAFKGFLEMLVVVSLYLSCILHYRLVQNLPFMGRVQQH